VSLDHNTSEGAEGAEATALFRPDNEITRLIIGASIEVHQHLGPGLLESTYEECLCYELSRTRLAFERQVQVPIRYKGLKLESKYKMDLIVEDRVVVEIKTVDALLPIHSAQLLTYLKASGKEVGLLINFNETVLKKGIKRLVNNYAGPRVGAPISASSAHIHDVGGAVSTPQEPLSFSPRPTPRLRASAVKTPVAGVKTLPGGTR
jgi:GxxExxY protein